MYRRLFILAIGIIIGVAIGAFGTYFMLSPHLGDEYTIKRPKIKGDDNIFDITQDNIKHTDNKKQKTKRRWKKNKEVN